MRAQLAGGLRGRRALLRRLPRPGRVCPGWEGRALRHVGRCYPCSPLTRPARRTWARRARAPSSCLVLTYLLGVVGEAQGAGRSCAKATGDPTDHQMSYRSEGPLLSPQEINVEIDNGSIDM